MTVREKLLKRFKAELIGLTPLEVLNWAGSRFGSRVKLASALGLEAQVLTHLINRNHLPIKIFTVDTGKLFPETYELLQKTEQTYNFCFEVYRPHLKTVREMVDTYGADLYRKSQELREHCCNKRKVEPLNQALKGVKAWLTGLRQGHSQSRSSSQVIQWEEGPGLYKINPLWNWSADQVREFIRTEAVPYNKLTDQGYPSIGCAPCTRAVKPGEDLRAGRWWWETSSKKECGIHISDGKVCRKPPVRLPFRSIQASL